jgi:hypothetical protein
MMYLHLAMNSHALYLNSLQLLKQPGSTSLSLSGVSTLSKEQLFSRDFGSDPIPLPEMLY